MPSNKKQQRLELTWFNKDKALIPTENGKYGYSWVSPQDPRYCQTRPLVFGETVEGVQAPKQPTAAHSALAELEPTTGNLLINGESGDVLEALTRVPELVGEYLGKVKLCYIDPPFNTEKTFTHYEDNLEHSIWLTMMRDRLLHIKKLLSHDGSIWVHLDDSENHRMRVLLDEIFGPGNFMAEVVWQKADSPRSDSGGFSDDHDIILVYRKSPAFDFNRLPRTAADNMRFTNPDRDPNGPWWDDNPTAPGAATHPGMVYAIQQPITGDLIYPAQGRHWAMNQDTLLEIMKGWGRYELVDLADDAERARLCGLPIEQARPGVKGIVIPGWNSADSDFARSVMEQSVWPLIVIRGGGHGGFGMKSGIPTRGNVPRTWWSNDRVGHNRAAKSEIKALFPRTTPFDTPKPERLLERIIHIATNPGDIVLDVFAGSGTTAAVAHKMGRRWVTCELLESNFSQFTLPRLTKVVRGEDPGGITTTAGERVDATENGLPENLTPEEAQKLTSLLNKAIKGDDDLKKDKTVSKIKEMVKTKNSGDMINWRGGGSFHVAQLAPECFDYDPELGVVTLTLAALDADVLERSVAAHLSFRLTPEHPVFTGIRGRTRLLVIRSVATPDLVAEIASHLDADEKVVIAATAIDPDTAQALRQTRKGSRVVHIPNDLFRVDEIEG
ncbi:site-specific DNA-methyltransferase [Dietzia kunjamensis]|uniref:site-specific DNA-methyltransferase n=1 Tax=Dietzia kunjamensis TaxID=322509 RepID=UPI0039BCEB9E